MWDDLFYFFICWDVHIYSEMALKTYDGMKNSLKWPNLVCINDFVKNQSELLCNAFKIIWSDHVLQKLTFSIYTEKKSSNY